MQISRNQKIVGTIIICLVIFIYIDPIPTIITPNLKTTCGTIVHIGPFARKTVYTFIYKTNKTAHKGYTSSAFECNKVGDNILVCYDSVHPQNYDILWRLKDLAANHVTDTCNCLKKVKKTEWYIDDYTK